MMTLLKRNKSQDVRQRHYKNARKYKHMIFRSHINVERNLSNIITLLLRLIDMLSLNLTLHKEQLHYVIVPFCSKTIQIKLALLTAFSVPFSHVVHLGITIY